MTTLALLLLLAADKEAAADPWAFEGASAKVNAKGATRDLGHLVTPVIASRRDLEILRNPRR